MRKLKMLLTTLALTAAGLGSAGAATPGLKAKAVDAAAIDRVAEARGEVPVIVELNLARRLGPARAGALSALAADAPARLAANQQATGAFLARYFGTRAMAADRTAQRRPVKVMRYEPVVAFTATPADLARLAADPEVARVWRDVAVRPTLDSSVPLIGVPTLTANGQTGQNAIVVVLDTGSDLDHPFIQPKIVAEACFSSNTAQSSSLCPSHGNSQTGTGSSAACDPVTVGHACSHGTHVAGIAVGATGVPGAPAQGVASGASLFSVQVFSNFPGQGALSWSSDQMAALEHVYSRRNDFPGKTIAAVNMSLGGGQYAGVCTDSPLRTIIGTLRGAGILTVVAAGNDGYGGQMSSPACTEGAVSVGSSNDGDVRSSFSNVSPITSVFAPGESITSSVVGGGYDSWNGTSMATPHVAGAIALLRAAYPGATADQIVDALKSTGKPVSTPVGTKPRIDVAAAWQALGAGGGGGGGDDGGSDPTGGNLLLSADDPVEIARTGNDVDITTFSLTVSPADGSVVNWKLKGVPSWLKASATKGKAGAAGTTVRFTVKAPKSQTEDLDATLQFVDTAAETDPVEVPVSLNLVEQTLSVEPGDAVTILNTNGLKASPSSFEVTVFSDVGSAPFKVTGVPSWLKAKPTSAVATMDGTTVTFTAVPAKGKSDLTGTVTFAMPSFSRSSATLEVANDYTEQTLAVTPQTDTTITWEGDQPTLASVDIMVATSGGEADWTVTGVPSWLVVDQKAGTTDDQGMVLSFAVNPPATMKKDLKATLKFAIKGLKKTQASVPIVFVKPPVTTGR